MRNTASTHEHLRDLIEDLATVYPDGTPALVLVDDYRERAELVKAIADEIELYGIRPLISSTPEEAQQSWACSRALPSTTDGSNISQTAVSDSSLDQAAIALIDAGAAEQWGPWLEANREFLPQWVRFLIVFTMPDDVPILARTAPAFLSWAKGLEFRNIFLPEDIDGKSIDAELAKLTQATGLTAEAFIEAWQQGKVLDSFRNTTWLNLAWAATRRQPR